MKDKLIGMVAEKAGLSADQASSAVDTVLGFLKDNPDQVKGLIGLDQDNMLDEAKEKLGEVGGKIGKLLKR